jgi:hypothetical protein
MQVSPACETFHIKGTYDVVVRGCICVLEVHAHIFATIFVEGHTLYLMCGYALLSVHRHTLCVNKVV